MSDNVDGEKITCKKEENKTRKAKCDDDNEKEQLRKYERKGKKVIWDTLKIYMLIMSLIMLKKK